MTPGPWIKDVEGCEWDKVCWKRDVAIFKYLKSFNRCTVSSEKPLLKTQFGDSPSYKWQFTLSEPMRVLGKPRRGKIGVGVGRAPGHRQIHWHKRGRQRMWSLHRWGGSPMMADFISYKGIRKTMLIVRDTKGSESSLSSEADCFSVLWEIA